jgi:hypothetical protein
VSKSKSVHWKGSSKVGKLNVGLVTCASSGILVLLRNQYLA